MTNNDHHVGTWQPRQNRFLGWLLTTTGFSAFVGSLIPAIIAQDAGPHDDLYMLLSLVMFGGGATLVIYGKRHLTRRAEDVLAKDPRAPIVFLRSFGEESEDFGLRSFFRAVGTAFTSRSMGLTVSPWGPTFQSQLAMVMERIGPYIAVGRPGAPLPGTGAARLYVPDDLWQARVCELLQGARLVIIRAGTSAGLQWEIKNVMQSIRPQQLLVILPIDPDAYRAFRDSIADAGIELPAQLPRATLMSFDARWRPVFLEPAGKLENTLAPYFRSNGIAPPSVSTWDAVRLFFR